METPIIDPEGNEVKGVLDIDTMQSSRHHPMPRKAIKNMQTVLDRLSASKKVTTTKRARNLAFMAGARTRKGKSTGRPNFMAFAGNKRYLNWEKK